MSVSRVCENTGRMAEAEMALTTLGAFLETVRQGVVNPLATEYVTRVCGNYGVLIRVSHSMICQSFATRIFRVLCHMHCSPILAPLAIARLAEVDSDATGTEFLLIEYEQLRSIFYFSHFWGDA